MSSLLPKAVRIVEVGARDWPQHCDQNNKDCTGGQRVPEQRNSDVSACQPLRHDARPDNRCQKKCCADEFSGQFL